MLLMLEVVTVLRGDPQLFEIVLRFQVLKVRAIFGSNRTAATATAAATA